MKYIIMADGKGCRWKNYGNIPKHFASICGEPIIKRTIRILNQLTTDQVIVTSHNPEYEFDGAIRYAPESNILEIDRFTYELIDDNCCFLYGDTYYAEECLKTIVFYKTEEISFFGNKKSIVGIKIRNGELFKKHIKKVKKMYLNGDIDSCIGWQVYQSYAGIKVGNEREIYDDFIFISNQTFDLNSPEEYIKRKRMLENEENDWIEAKN